MNTISLLLPPLAPSPDSSLSSYYLLSSSSSSHSPSPLMVSSLLLFYTHTDIHTHALTNARTHTDFYNQPSLFSNAHMCMCPELPTWNWTSYTRTHSWKDLILPLSGAIDPWSSLSRVGPCEITTFHVGVVTGIVTMLVLLKQLILLSFCGYIFPVIPRRYYLVASIPGLWLLQRLYRLFPDLASKTKMVSYHSIGSLPEHAGKTLLLKTMHISETELGGIKMELTWKPPSQRLTLIAYKGPSNLPMERHNR